MLHQSPLQTLIAPPFFKGYLSRLPVKLPAGKSLNMSNITQVLNVDRNLKTLKKGVYASDLDQLLSSTGPFTFFTPSDIAFEKLEKGMMDDLLEPQNRVKLTELMNNHIVNGKILFADLKDGDQLTTINGKELKVQVKNNHVTIGGINIFLRESKILNGVIHTTDQVIV